MNIATANAIPLSEILAKMGFIPSYKRQETLWYLSPLRDEKTPSFKVNPAMNTWRDFGEGLGGAVIGFVCIYLERQNLAHSVKDALRWLSEHVPEIKPLPASRKPVTPPQLVFKLQRVSSVHTKYLIDYIIDRGITVAIARKYLREIDFYNSATQRTFKALGLRNTDEGYELRNRAFKGSVKSKNVSFIRGSTPPATAIHVFEGMFDHLSALLHEKGRKFEDDVIVLNSISNLEKAFPYIRDYPYTEIHTWFDNDLAGEKATQAFKSLAAEMNVKHRPKNEIYAPHKDVNAWHLANLNP